MKFSEVSQIALTDIDLEDRLTDFSLDGCPEKLMDSIKVIGIRHPISVYSSNKKGHILISGHKRFQAAPRCGLTHIPAFIIPEMDDTSRLVLNLNENFGQRHYSDIEKGRILNKLSRARIDDETIIKDYMPLLELERSKKIFLDLSSVGVLSFKLQKLLHDALVPIKTFSIFYKWDEESRAAAENLFATLKPGVNKWRELLELVDEIARILSSDSTVDDHPFADEFNHANEHSIELASVWLHRAIGKSKAKMLPDPKDFQWTLDPTLKRDTVPVGDLPLSRVLLINDANYPWLLLVPRRAGK